LLKMNFLFETNFNVAQVVLIQTLPYTKQKSDFIKFPKNNLYKKKLMLDINYWTSTAVT